jgi:hypothetical protein
MFSVVLGATAAAPVVQAGVHFLSWAQLSRSLLGTAEPGVASFDQHDESS